MPPSFSCDAEKLLGLIKDFYGSKWEAPPRVKKVSRLLGGKMPIFMDGKPLTERKEEDEELEIREDAAKQVFMKMVVEVYKGVPPDIVLCGIDSWKWRYIVKIVLFGKENGVSRGDWFAALRK